MNLFYRTLLLKIVFSFFIILTSPPASSQNDSEKEQERRKIVEQLRYRLDVKTTCNLTPTWKDKGSGADYDGFFYEPVTQEEFFILGDFGSSKANHSGNQCVVLVKEASSNPALTPKLLVAPERWELVWNDSGSGADLDGAMWKAISPSNDYKCIGNVVRVGYDKPNPRHYRCVHVSLTQKFSGSSIIWSDKGSGADKKVTVFHLPVTGSFAVIQNRSNNLSGIDLRPNAENELNLELVEEKLAVRMSELKEARELATRKKIEARARKLEFAARKKKEARAQELKLAARKTKEANELAARKKEAVELAARKKKDANELAAKKKNLELEKQREIARLAKIAEEKKAKILAEKRKKEAAEKKVKDMNLRREMVRSSFLFGGNEKDYVFLVNLSSDNVTLGLSGKPTFLNLPVSACYIQPGKSNSNQEFMDEALTQAKLEVGSEFVFKQCGDIGLESSEIIMFQRSIINNAQMTTLKSLVAAHNDKVLFEFYVADASVFEARNLAKAQAEEKAKRELIEKKQKIKVGVLAGTLDGYGALMIDSSSEAVCIENPDKFNLKGILSEGEVSDVKMDSLDNIFLHLKTLKCSAFFGKSESLKILFGALQRDKLQVEFSPRWYDAANVEAKQKKKEEAARLAAEAEQKRKVESERLVTEAEKKRKEEVARLAAEAKQKKKEEAVRLATEAEKKKKQEAIRLAAEAELKRKEEVARLAVEVEQKKKKEAERKKRAELKGRMVFSIAAADNIFTWVPELDANGNLLGSDTLVGCTYTFSASNLSNYSIKLLGYSVSTDHKMVGSLLKRKPVVQFNRELDPGETYVGSKKIEKARLAVWTGSGGKVEPEPMSKQKLLSKYGCDAQKGTVVLNYSNMKSFVKFHRRARVSETSFQNKIAVWNDKELSLKFESD